MPHPKLPTWQLIWHLISYTPKLYLVDSFFWILFMSLPGVTGLLIRAFFDRLAGPASLDRSLWGILVLLLVTDLGHITVLFICRFTKSQHRFTMRALLQRNLLVPLLNRPGASPMISTAGRPTVSPGEAISYFRDDTDEIQDLIATISEVTGAGMLAVGAIALLFSIHAPMTLLIFLPLVVMVVVVHQAQRHVKRYRQSSRRATEQVTGLMGEILSNVQAIKIAGAQPQVLQYFRQVNGQRHQTMVKDQLFTAVLKSAFENLYTLGTGVILLVAAQVMQTGERPLSIGDFALFIYYLPYVTYFLEFLGGFLTQIKQTEVSFERMAALLSGTEPASPTPQSPVAPPSAPSAYALVAHTPLYLNDLWGHRPTLPPIAQPDRYKTTRLQKLSAYNLTYHYPDTKRGIENITLQIRQGSITVITGPVGSGKTTLLRVLLGLLPMESGEIYWNENRVNDPATFFVPPRSSYTPQVPRLFSNPLRDNLLLGMERSPAELASAIEQAVFTPDVTTMPEGLDTLVGSKGLRLSGGQIQRAAAARMLVRQPDLLVFDDLSSALDMDTEQRLWQQLWGSGRVDTPMSKQVNPSEQPSAPTPPRPTLLIVSHRPWVLRHADHVIVLKDGRIQKAHTSPDL
ncbi:MAG: ABC transporter ATP-binding protein [Leptolyngbya sp. DLM2.Bin15]|nr:MAG: ABC transporter ATP-binding protein [Leptolyngbya sp. DLM2.Bin15]